MSFWQAFSLGLIQGLTEFLPISSSGHLLLLPRFFAWPDQGLAYDAVLHLSTSFAVIIALCVELKQIFSLVINKKIGDNLKTIFILFLSIAPVAFLGFLFDDWIEEKIRSHYVVAFSLIFWGVILWLAERYYYSHPLKTVSWPTVKPRQILAAGLSQIIAFIPGTSRSGITVSASIFSGLDKTLAVKLSFLIGLPLTFGAGLLQLIKMANTGFSSHEITLLSVSFVTALVSGLFSIKILLWFSRRANFTFFVIYRIILGIVIIAAF